MSTGQPAFFGAFQQVLGEAAVLLEIELEPEGPVDRGRTSSIDSKALVDNENGMPKS